MLRTKQRKLAKKAVQHKKRSKTSHKTPVLTTFKNTLATDINNASSKLIRKKTVRNQVVVPENYHATTVNEQVSREAAELKKKQDQEEQFFKHNTQPGDYTVYKSRLSLVPQLSTAILGFVGFSNAMMFEEWANHKIFDLPGPFWYAAGAASLAALTYGHYTLSSRWVKRITARVHAVNKLPATLTVTTGNIVGMDDTKEIPIASFRGLNASEAITAKNMNKAMISIDVATPQKYLILWRTRAHFANPAGALQKVLGLSAEKCNEIFVTSKGHTFNGKLYTDDDYQTVVNRLLQEKQGAVPILPDIHAQLDKLNGDALTFEKARALGVFKDEQEQELLNGANTALLQVQELQHLKARAELAGLKDQAKQYQDEIDALNEDAHSKIAKTINSIKHKNEFLINPVIDFNNFRKENAIELFKDVIQSQSEHRHPLTSQIKFVFGPDCDTPGSSSHQLKTLSSMYLSKHSNFKHRWGNPGTDEFGVLTLYFKQKEQFDPTQLDQSEFKQYQEVKL